MGKIIKNISNRMMIFIIIILFFSCSNNIPDKKYGQEVYRAMCLSCHLKGNGVGLEKAQNLEKLSKNRKIDLIEKLRFASGDLDHNHFFTILSEEEINDLLEFITTYDENTSK